MSTVAFCLFGLLFVIGIPFLLLAWNEPQCAPRGVAPNGPLPPARVVNLLTLLGVAVTVVLADVTGELSFLIMVALAPLNAGYAIALARDRKKLWLRHAAWWWRRPLWEKLITGYAVNLGSGAATRRFFVIFHLQLASAFLGLGAFGLAAFGAP